MAPWGDLLQVWRMTELQSSATPVQFPEGIDPDFRNPYHETHDIQLYKVDIDNQELMRITNLGDYALFLGLNSTMIISTKDFPMLRADCAYLAHDEHLDI
uniref:KIB1-4 beta-propeller domain-containing protein n=1 Tax=Arundo donax TaxID=35708 RepID=A0A0A9DC09_ARUDO